jgi:hypothetical protein
MLGVIQLLWKPSLHVQGQSTKIFSYHSSWLIRNPGFRVCLSFSGITSVRWWLKRFLLSDSKSWDRHKPIFPQLCHTKTSNFQIESRYLINQSGFGGESLITPS